jgi:hypothetical protein
MFWNRIQHPDHTDRAAGAGLGLASIGVALAELFATKQLQKLIGVEGPKVEGILRVLGIRELMHGVDLLTHDDPAPGLKARVVGDLLDGALLGLAGRQTKNPSGLAAAFALVAPIVIADLLFAKRSHH